MAAAGYMTELDVESIWNLGDFDTTRFGKINVRMGEILNFTVRTDMDAATDITDTKILPILEHLSEEGFNHLVAASKGSKFNNPWDFILANVYSVMFKLLRNNRQVIKQLKEEQESKIHLKYSGTLELRSHTD